MDSQRYWSQAKPCHSGVMAKSVRSERMVAQELRNTITVVNIYLNLSYSSVQNDVK
jgi:hypothetical protein